MPTLSNGKGASSNLYKRWFASSLAQGDAYQDRVYGARKARLFKDLKGRVLEIGVGTGTNLTYFPPHVQWVGIEPNPFMHRFVHEKANLLSLQIELHAGVGESLAFPESSFDAVISTLVLCSVSQPQKVLQELRRVLKPGGTFLFIEHIAASKGTFMRSFQKTVSPLWRLIADGCHPDRDTTLIIQQAGFSDLKLEPFNAALPLNPIRPHIMGWAIK